MLNGQKTYRIPNPDTRSNEQVQDSRNPYDMMPGGAKIIQSTFDNAKTQNMIYNNLLLQPRNAHPEQLFNPANPWSPNGLLGKTGDPRQDDIRTNIYNDIRNTADTIDNKEMPKGRQKDSRTQDHSRTEAGVTEESYQGMHQYFADTGQDPNALEEDNITEQINEAWEANENGVDLNQIPGITGFTSIPRIMGVIGTFVAPPSKISLNKMYNATLEAVLGSVLNIAKATIIGEFRNYSHPDEKVDWLMNKTIEALGRDKFFYRACDFLVAGNACGELITSTTAEGYSYFSKCVWAPFTNIQYQVDAAGDVMAALQPNLVARLEGIFSGTNPDIGEAEFAFREMIPQILPYVIVDRKNLFYVAYDSQFNPYGNSPMRRAYMFYEIKKMLLKMYSIAMSRNSVPTMVAYFDKNTVRNQEDIDFMKNSLSELSVGGIAFVPTQKGDGMEVEAMHLDSSGVSAFKEGFEYCDRMMSLSLCLNGDLLVGSGGSYSNAYINKETFQDTLSLFTNTIKNAFHEQVEKPIIYDNFPEIYDKGQWGEFVPSNVSNTERLYLTKQFDNGKSAGLIDPTNLNLVNTYMRSMGLPEYEKEEDLPANKNPDFIDSSGTSTREIDESPYSHNDEPTSSQEGGTK